LVEKAARRLVFYRDGTEVRRFRVGLGFAPVGTKEVQGDGKTPEGEYRVCRKNPQSRFHLSLGLDYPNATDAEAGFKAKRITRAQRDGIVAASKGRGCPPWETPLGGEIFIHGSGSSSDWTLGCVALDDPDMDFLYAQCSVGTPVEIRP
jgi:murein L,D-transpeptidase YafK